MAIDFTGTAPITGGGQVFVRNANGEWEKANVTAPGVVLTEITDGATFTPPPGAIGHHVMLWGPGDEEPVQAFYSVAEMGANASVNIGTEADGTDSTFNPAGTGATLTATAGYPKGSSVLASGTATGATTVAFDVGGYSYNSFELVVHRFFTAHTTEDRLNLQFSTDGGSTWITTASYEWSEVYVDDTMVSTTDITAGSGSGATLGQLAFYVNHNTSSSNIAGGYIRLYGLNEAYRPVVHAHASGTNHADSSSFCSWNNVMCYTTSCDAFRLLTGASANITLKYTLLGIG